ncbi:DUF5711 family protein [Wukongibacter baidiensis]|uniref:DUF5711 family protein n=1 Tax=Wukongibacter baidiensis TaxID=1723361 RepID=UPI003D7FBBFE
MAKKRKKRNKIRFLIFLLTIIGLTFGLIKLGAGLKDMLGNKSINLKRTGIIEYAKRKQDDKKVNIEISNEHIIKFEKNKLSTYNQKGDKVWEKELSLDEAVIRGNGNIIVAAGALRGEIYFIDYEGSIKVEKSIDKKILDININNDGYVFVMLETEIYVFDPAGEIISNFVIPKGTVFDGDLSRDSSKIALTILAVEENKFYSNIIFYSLDGKVLAGKKYDNDVIYKILLTDDNTLLVLGSNKILKIAEDGNVLWEKRLDGTLNKGILTDKGVLVLNIVSKKNTIIDTKSRNTIRQLDLAGNVIKDTPVAGEVLGLDVVDDKIATFTDRTIYIFGKNGDMLLEKKINKDIKDIKWISRRNLLVKFKDRLEIMTLN